jgi:CRISPR-associated endonuclease Cas3-HD
MVVYSFKGERLAEHSYLVFRLYHEMFGPTHERLVAKRLGVDPRQVSEAECAACLLHDVGKALNGFQQGIERGGGFRFHELVSALFTYDTLRNALSDADYVVRHLLSFAAAYAVLQHHQAMRNLSEAFGKGSGLLPPLSEGVHRDVVNEITMAAQIATHLFDASKVLKAFKGSVEEASREGFGVWFRKLRCELENVMIQGAPRGIPPDRMEDWTKAWGRLQPALPLFTAPLQLCDYLAALVTRGGRMRRLHRESLLLLRRASLNLLANRVTLAKRRASITTTSNLLQVE